MEMTLQELDAMINKYLAVFDSIYVEPRIFIFLVMIVSSIFIIRYFIISNTKASELIGNKSSIKMYHKICMWHCFIGAVVTIIIAYIIIKLTNANPESLILNYVIAPGIGLMISISFDNRVLNQNDMNNNKLFSMFGIIRRRSKHTDDRVSAIQNSILENDTADTDKISVNETSSNSSNTIDDVKHITQDDTVSDEYNIIIKESINTLIDNQHIMRDEMREQSSTINAVKESIANDKQLELEKMIYDALQQGYVTPKQDKEIRSKYHVYFEVLKGSDDLDIEELYHERYLKLHVHDDHLSVILQDDGSTNPLNNKKKF